MFQYTVNPSKQWSDILLRVFLSTLAAQVFMRARDTEEKGIEGLTVAPRAFVLVPQVGSTRLDGQGHTKTKVFRINLCQQQNAESIWNCVFVFFVRIATNLPFESVVCFCFFAARMTSFLIFFFRWWYGNSKRGGPFFIEKKNIGNSSYLYLYKYT